MSEDELWERLGRLEGALAALSREVDRILEALLLPPRPVERQTSGAIVTVVSP